MTGEGVALLAVTRRGAAQMVRLRAAWPQAELWLPAPRAREVPGAMALDGTVQNLLPQLWTSRRGLVMGLAVGAAVRLIAPYLQDKTRDPAVVTVDETGRYAVALVSAHLGGANALARLVAEILGADAVITTASEGVGLEPLDSRLAELGYRIDNPQAMAALMTARLDGQWVRTTCDPELVKWAIWDGTGFAAQNAPVPPWAYTIRLSVRQRPSPGAREVLVRPPALVVGIGCVRGVRAEEIASAVQEAFQFAGLSVEAVGTVATIDIKREEAGLLQWARSNGLGLRFFGAEALNRVAVPDPSDTVHQATGAWAVSRPAAMLAAAGGPLLLDKWKTAKVTVSVAVKLRPDDLPATGT
ncbi:MAG: cobalamin biosynthesis protein [Thermaerobacter sp.]|nr:cobalamin biosynthesis protein [Thermaerobacter sp.]